ncbi:rhodanese-like domain-containing protein [Natronomonas gomsonensis]|uniref:rhodanese-like domain-containing protein n=1 Tax=Natronomonas gomsonensis TaxID=1046043 RepID=UPI0020CA8A94|nr:rhodanese-like domain-containing protein [Natronomonas gomsonensis]MCY4730203.1 rhodanese-like domain-containing protein [Natronomonas gomsonensis]
MHRRSFLASTGAAAAAFAGCLGGDGESDDGSGNDGYPPASEDTPEPMGVDTDGFQRIDVEGTAVPLAPIEVTYNWYRRREARFADARGEGQYERAHIEGAAWSPAPEGRTNDPVKSWPREDRIVCYCGCPHHLSSLRAATLIEAGYENVYVIDEGFFEWLEREYPAVGSEIQNNVASYTIAGRTDPAHAEATVYAAHEPTDQREAAFVDDDGGYEMTLHFGGLTEDSEIRLETPAYELLAPLSELTAGVITGP